MRWFKHMTRSWDDEKLAFLVEKHGLEGYGFYFRLVEIVAGNIDENSDSVVTYSLRRWSELTAIFQPKVKKLCQVCSDLGLIEFELAGEKLKVAIPKIFKYRDEYSEKRAKGKKKNRDNIPTVSGQTPEQETDTDTDTDVDVEKRAKECAKSPTTPTKTTTVDFVDTPQKPPVSVSASTSILPSTAADRNRLAEALGKLQVSDAELLVWQELKAQKDPVTLADIEAARKRKGQNRLTMTFLADIACEERDRRQAASDDDCDLPKCFYTGAIQ
jgi:rRNA maturation protein Nop10